MQFLNNFSQGFSIGFKCIEYVARYPTLMIFTAIPTLLNTFTALSALNTLLHYTNAIDVMKAAAQHHHTLIKFHLQLPHSFTYLLIIFLITTMFSSVFTAALQYYTKQTLDNTIPSFFTSLRVALSHIFSLLLWNILSFGVYALIGKISNFSQSSTPATPPRPNFLATTLQGLWSFATFFVIPFIIFDNQNVFKALYNSYEFTKNNFSHYMGAHIAIKAFRWMINSILIIFLIPCGIIIWYAFSHSSELSNSAFSYYIMAAFILVALPLSLFIFPFKHAVNNIFAVVLYNYSHNKNTDSFESLF